MYGRGVPKRGFATAIVLQGDEPSLAGHILAGDFDDAVGEAGGADADEEDAAAFE